MESIKPVYSSIKKEPNHSDVKVKPNTSVIKEKQPYSIEKIIIKRTLNGKVEYCLKWKFYHEVHEA